MLTQVTDIPVSQLQNEVSALKRDGYRFVTMTCTDLGDAHDILYHFDKQQQLRHLRLSLKKGDTLPSISNLLFAALIVENEIKDLFGIPVSDLAIDYQGRFILSENAPKAPLNKTRGIGVDVRQMPPAEGGPKP